MLQFNPDKRISAAEALRHLTWQCTDPNDEPGYPPLNLDDEFWKLDNKIMRPEEEEEVPIENAQRHACTMN
ncbi:CBM_collapsed_G0003470.mRNA.1.CDS.1 [Saccharomyces cerevisiae]|nr:CBM_collapsed_G0003470.mRNA.1.CDS.1 [Saccharomyces cerevisiae]